MGAGTSDGHHSSGGHLTAVVASVTSYPQHLCVCSELSISGTILKTGGIDTMYNGDQDIDFESHSIHPKNIFVVTVNLFE